MANKKISELTELTEPMQNDVLAIVNSNETKKITVENIKKYVKPSEASTSEAGLLSAEDKANIDNNTQARHTHTNKEILDNTTASYTAEEQTKLSNIEAGAEVNKVASVNGKTGAVVLNAGDVGAIAEPTSEGTNGQVLATDGAGGRSWVTVSAGEGGTTDYTALSNKPKINNVELTGNKTSEDLGLATHTHTNKTVLDNITASYTTEEQTKLSGIEAGAQVNTVASVNGKTGAVTVTVPTKTSQLTNDSNFISSTDLIVTGKTTTTTVSLGFKPRLVILYAKYNNDDISLNSSNAPGYNDIPVILTQSYISDERYYINSNGFKIAASNYISSGGIYYIAVK